MENLKFWVELLSNIATIAAVFVIFFAYRAYKISKKHLTLKAITRCIDNYREHFVEIDYKTKAYLDFVNEELFYFEKDYIIDKVIIFEWLDGMIDVLPIFRNGNVLNENYCNKIIKDLLKPHPRIIKAFTVIGNYKFDIIYSSATDSKDRKEMRNKLFEEILKNLKP